VKKKPGGVSGKTPRGGEKKKKFHRDMGGNTRCEEYSGLFWKGKKSEQRALMFINSVQSAGGGENRKICLKGGRITARAYRRGRARLKKGIDKVLSLGKGEKRVSPETRSKPTWSGYSHQ